MRKGGIKRLFNIFLVCLFSGLGLTACQPQPADSSSIMVFSAASLRDALEEIGEQYQAKSGVRVVFNFGGSNMLARQIEVSRKADVFLSANRLWVDYLADKQLLIDKSKQQFLSNSLVFIANINSSYKLTSAQDVVNLSFRFFSIGDPKAVPAGGYAKAYLSSVQTGRSWVKDTEPNPSARQSVWHHLENKILPTPDVRAATAAVASIPDVIGMVYKTDALASKDVRILFEPLVEDAPEIQYFGVLIDRQRVREKGTKQKHNEAGVDESTQTSLEFLNFLSKPESKFIFRKHGFIAHDKVQPTETDSATPDATDNQTGGAIL